MPQENSHFFNLRQLLLSFLKHLLAHCQSASSVVSALFQKMSDYNRNLNGALDKRNTHQMEAGKMYLTMSQSA